LKACVRRVLKRSKREIERETGRIRARNTVKNGRKRKRAISVFGWGGVSLMGYLPSLTPLISHSRNFITILLFYYSTISPLFSIFISLTFYNF